ncbi:MAG: TPM domain-containing protein [Pedobacter sp.]|nr:MAG: TPM domain-containing protein [Pedobacter sp.]
MFNLFKKPDFLSSSEKEKVIAAIKTAEMRTSGEIRVYIESRCKYVDIYVAVKDQQMAILGDEWIHRKVGEQFWNAEISKMRRHFQMEHYMDALVLVIEDVGHALDDHFPFDQKSDKNELPDDIVFGK